MSNFKDWVQTSIWQKDIVDDQCEDAAKDGYVEALTWFLSWETDKEKISILKKELEQIRGEE